VIVLGRSTSVAQEESAFVRITAGEVRWRKIPAGHGAQEAILFGDPDKPGMYVIRVKFPPHVMDLPHWHPNDRFVTVLEGVWYSGTGDRFDPARAVPLKPGRFMLHPAKAVHWDVLPGPNPWSFKSSVMVRALPHPWMPPSRSGRK
jgi:hypothetical protein